MQIFASSNAFVIHYIGLKNIQIYIQNESTLYLTYIYINILKSIKSE